jgi:type I restriction enzyme M protein
MDDTDKYFEEEDNTKLIKKVITADAKSKKDDIDTAVKVKLQSLVNKWAEQTKVNKEIKVAKAELEDLTVEAIKTLSDDNAELLLHKKWITPLCEEIATILSKVLNGLTKLISSLENKYAVSYNEIGKELNGRQAELADMIQQLSGDAYTLMGLHRLSNQFKG